tara:strand:+ start:249 stop:821 length:573 start_codon:yes stop_codon:yes gene_type:complete
MKKICLLLITFFLLGCSSSKPKTVFICGDHECINKNEAKQYFEDNLTLEVKIINKKNKESVDLVELNLKSNDREKREINVYTKKETDSPLKKLSKLEIKNKKNELKKRKKILKKENKSNKKKGNKRKSLSKLNEKNKKKDNLEEKITHNSKKQIVDVCKIINECNIEEISKYLLKKGKEKDFPDITTREL